MFLKPPPSLLAPAGLSRASLALIALAFLATLAMYVDTVRSIVAIWNSSETFAHGYLILPISLWLIWRRRDNFRTIPARPCWPALALVALLGAGWLVARMGEVQVIQQYAMVAMLPAIALALFGPRLASSLAFPLLFMLFSVPFGEIFVPRLIEFTADFTVWALQLTGIPVLRNGTRFEIPSGSWSVVTACSGVRYLISSITIGCLYAYLTYRSTLRRTLFIATSIVVPIIANGMRAYMIVMIGHLSGNELAQGVDHLIYGWLFFGLVMFIMFWIGSYWRDDEPAGAANGSAGSAPARKARAPRASRISPAMTAAVLALAGAWPAFAVFNDRATFNPHPVTLAAPQTSWTAAPAFTTWVPNFLPADASYSGTFGAVGTSGASGSMATSGASGLPPVGLTILYYRNQTNVKTLISSSNTLTGEHDRAFEKQSEQRSEQVDGRKLAVREAILQTPEGLVLVWHWIWVDQRYTSNIYVGKLHQAESRLRFRGDDGAAVLVSAPYHEQPDEARKALRAFLDANLGAIDSTLAQARGR